MSGLVGWIDRERDLSSEGVTAFRRMAAVVARGRRGEELWLSDGLCAVLEARPHTLGLEDTVAQVRELCRLRHMLQ